MDLGAAILALCTGLIVKVAVMALGGWLLLQLHRATRAPSTGRAWLRLPEEDLPEVRLVHASLVLVGVAELSCAIEAYVLLEPSAWLSGIHAVCSAAGMGLLSLGVYLYLDKKVLRYGRKACVASRLCGSCTHDTEAGCRYRAALMLAALFVAMAGLAPWFVPAERLIGDPRRWALPFESWNAWYDGVWQPWLQRTAPGYAPASVAYELPASLMLIELRLEPAVALALALVALVLAWSGRERLASRLLVFALGVLAYVYLELVLYRGTGDVYLGSLGHEVVELWFLVLVAELLRRTFPPEPRARAGEAARVPLGPVSPT